MENQNLNQAQNQYGVPQNPQQLVFSEAIQSELKTVTAWSKFICILAFISQAFMILAGIFAFIGIKYSPMELRKMLLFVGAFYIIAAIVTFIPTLKCMQFACRANDAMRYGEQQTMEKAFANLAFATKYQGIISIICIVLAVVWIVLVVSNPTLLSTHHY